MQCNILAASRPWYDGAAERLQQMTGSIFYRVSSPEELSALDLGSLRPRYVFVPHWSWILPKSVWGCCETIIFHMTDLPFGRGGSPLQNLILQGVTETKITALRCEAGIDAGPIYAKEPLSLHGSAEEIFIRASAKIETIIISILQTNPTPVPQQGEQVIFARRSPKDGNIANIKTLNKIYDHIRMLDATGYPPAFFQSGPIRFEFKRAALRFGKIEADVTITITEESENA